MAERQEPSQGTGGTPKSAFDNDGTPLRKEISPATKNKDNLQQLQVAVGADGDRLKRIHPSLRIRVIYEDDDIVVIEKPCNLRSVPGHANPPPAKTTEEQPERQRKRPFSEAEENDGQQQEISIVPEGGQALHNNLSANKTSRMTAQQAWEAAIRSFSSDDTGVQTTSDNTTLQNNNDNQLVWQCLKQLAVSDSLVTSIPRKWKSFHRYILRNQKRIVLNNKMATTVEELATKMYAALQKLQQSFLNLPEPTRHEESAYGQLILMGYGNSSTTSGTERGAALTCQVNDNNGDNNSHNTTGTGGNDFHQNLYVVHRLDCETSGVMVFARNQSAASKLCEAWRKRDLVSKVYWAKVHEWPPYHKGNMTEGCIDLALAPSQEERLKWNVVDKNDAFAKPSKTLWRILQQNDIRESSRASDNGGSKDGTHNDQHSPLNEAKKEFCIANQLLLELTPITGRTHQLRVHCAHVGSGIIGDSLYGQEKLITLGQDGQRLLLHAYKLTFPHPRSSQTCAFTAASNW